MDNELEELSMEYERTHAAAVITEKRAHNFDKVVGEWKCKADDLTAELEACRSEARNYSSEVFRLQAAYEETNEQLDIVKRENKNLADEIKDLLDQLGEGGRSIHALDKQRRMLEQEKEELQQALEEAEATLEMEENRVLRSQLELANVRQEIDRRVAEKEEEFNNTRKNHSRAMESLGASIEAEQRAKGEALRIKKQLEGEINELEIGLDHANKANSPCSSGAKTPARTDSSASGSPSSAAATANPNSTIRRWASGVPDANGLEDASRNKRTSCWVPNAPMSMAALARCSGIFENAASARGVRSTFRLR